MSALIGAVARILASPDRANAPVQIFGFGELGLALMGLAAWVVVPALLVGLAYAIEHVQTLRQRRKWLRGIDS